MTVVCTLGQPGIQVFLASSGRSRAAVYTEMRHQAESGNEVLRYRAPARKNWLRAAHYTGVQLLHPCIQVFLTCSIGRVQAGQGQHRALR
jgi:hypothetical protein